MQAMEYRAGEANPTHHVIPAPPEPPQTGPALDLAIEHGRHVLHLLDVLENRLFDGGGVEAECNDKPARPAAISWQAHLLAQLNGEAAQRLEAVLKRL